MFPRNIQLAARKRLENYFKKKLENKVEALVSQIDAAESRSPEIEKDSLETKTKLDKIYVKECKGAGIRARVQWMGEGEKTLNIS